MNDQGTGSGDWESRKKANTRRLGYWTAAWVGTQAVAVFGPQFAWDNNTLTWIALLINVLMGAGMVLANKRHLRGLDEMHQRVQLEAMALTLGVGLVVGLAYSTADVTNLIPADAEISHLIILLGLTYFTATVLGLRQYR